MKTNDLFEKTTKGTYAGVKFSPATVKAIKEYIETNSIPNATKSSKLHTTLLYSRKFLPNYKPLGRLEKPLVGKFKKFDVWLNTSAEKNRCLVLVYSCPELVKRHKALMKEHGATYDYSTYHAHLTLSYDIGDIDIKDLPPFTAPIQIVSEYGEDLDLDWATTHGKK